MTWQRIDENTYIDNTLVTCTNYQLFIDEMCEQEKYYQPDHWTSYQFPNGRAFEPILGVRPSDAVAFCEWLAKRENGIWTYRLPTSDEARESAMCSPNQNPVCYYIQIDKGKPQIAWVSGIPPEDARYLDRSSLSLLINLDYSIPLDVVNFSSTQHLNVDTLIGGNLFNIANRLTQKLKQNIFVRNRDTNANDSSFNEIIHVVDGAIKNLGELNDVLNHAFNRKFIKDRDLAKVSGVTRHCINEFLRMREISVIFGLSRLVTQAIKYTQILYIDLETLRLRAKEHSPAFEGIRLVKERIR